jgi:hypothetical protein
MTSAIFRFLICISLLALCFSCNQKEGFDYDGIGEDGFANGCEGPEVFYSNWETSKYVLPFPVGLSYTIGLSNCGGFPHAVGDPDQFAIDFLMNVGTLVTASRKGTIMFVEESGLDYEFPNNLVILRDEDGMFLQYHHLTHNGAIVEQGQFVEKGDPIGYSGASGTAGHPHLHFVGTDINWQSPYTSRPLTFSNTTENPRSLIQGETYLALPY